MVGRGIDTLYPKRHESDNETRLVVNNLSLKRAFNNVNFSLKRGEIVGIAGLVGSGREELIDVLYRLRKANAGSVTFEGEKSRINKPSDAVANGIVLVPRDRRNTGLVLDMTVADNINLASLNKVSTFKLERKSRSIARAKQLIEDLEIRPQNPSTITRFLSAVFIGAALNRYGRPSVTGTLIGVLFLGMIANGLNLMGLNYNTNDALEGIILVVVLALAVYQQKSSNYLPKERVIDMTEQFDAIFFGFTTLDISGRPVNSIPDSGGIAFLDEIRINPAGTAADAEFRVPAFNVEVSDTTGCGDSYCGGRC